MKDNIHEITRFTQRAQHTGAFNKVRQTYVRQKIFDRPKLDTYVRHSQISQHMFDTHELNYRCSDVQMFDT